MKSFLISTAIFLLIAGGASLVDHASHTQGGAIASATYAAIKSAVLRLA
jgi:uncharacterized protein YceK